MSPDKTKETGTSQIRYLIRTDIQLVCIIMTAFA